MPIIEQNRTETLTPLGQIELGLPIADSPRPLLPAAKLWPVAIHEASHAVVALYYGIPFTFLTIRPRGTGGVRLDSEKHHALLDSNACRYASKTIIASYAGFLGHLKVFPSVSRDGAEYDMDQAGGLLFDNFKYERILDKPAGVFRCPTEDEIYIIAKRRGRRLWRITYRLVRRLFPVIQVVAMALLERKRLTSDEVVALVGPLVAKKRAALNKPRRLKTYETVD